MCMYEWVAVVVVVVVGVVVGVAEGKGRQKAATRTGVSRLRDAMPRRLRPSTSGIGRREDPPRRG